VRRPTAAAGSALFFVVAPCVVAGLVPWLLTRWRTESWPPAVRVAGALLLAAGAVAIVQSFVRFVVEGGGTPAPVGPTERLVVGGLYRYVRNPIYIALVLVIVGQALLLGRFVLLVYAVAVWAACALFVLAYEEPTLRRQFGRAYEEYRRAVPAWLPRLRPWRPDG
jgi:protein-S-isoprenylcysteine O-methyltransferase Ste14